MRLLFIIPDFAAGGAQKQCALLFNYLHVLPGVDAYLLHVRKGVNYRWLEASNNVIKLERESLSDPRIVLDILRVVKRNDIDTLVSWLHPADTYAFLTHAICPRLKWIMTERDSKYPAGWQYTLRNWFARYADRIIANSKEGAAYWRERGIDGTRISTTLNILSSQPTGGRDIGSRDNILGFLGRFEPQKNVNLAAIAICESARDFSDQCFLAGSGSQRALVESIITSSKTASVELLGYVDDSEALLRNTRIFISLSLHEGSPNSLIEAVAAGCLVVATDIAEHTNILGEGYPLIVRQDSSASDVLAAINTAKEYISQGSLAVSEVMYFARAYLKQLTPSRVAVDYIDAVLSAKG